MNQKWLENILENLHKEAYLWSRHCCGFNDELAKDILQTVYLKIMEGKAKYHEKSNIKTWLFAIIRHTAIDQMKMQTNFENLDLLNEVQDSADEAVEAHKYEYLIRQLPERQQQVLLLVFYFGVTLEVAANIMEISLGTARTHYDRGKKKLKELIIKSNSNE